MAKHMIQPTIYSYGACFGRGGTPYLQLHALRAPLGPYVGVFAADLDPHNTNYDIAVNDAVRAFEAEHDCKLVLLGRSGRHVCIEDTPRNRRRYVSLQRKAIAAAHALWAMMRGEDVTERRKRNAPRRTRKRNRQRIERHAECKSSERTEVNGMTKKDYERAARIAQAEPAARSGSKVHANVVEAFVALFRSDNPRFDEERFRAACVPGANVKARPRKVQS